MRVIWLSTAEEQLDSIYEFVACNNPSAAVDIYNTIIEETDRLSTFPGIASLELSLEEETESYRSLVVNRTYKVIYRINLKAEEVVVVSVWDCRQEPEKLRRRVRGK
ncbi:type II toxin-antitoxin system RelE/ParE family toxin [Bacteroides sp. OttesenSCG-928-J23]|nr:type II toxin-antitoxin system RelE/ParE family toxin [Bacteroides sp. OttesenSCG-928-J23]MDL2299239.1 type II toxin-antitoxin system RelE/ParE family toxin [Bacteroides sp. OttesenSCG-928-E20]MDL2304601.1 type II toxin-antitoxin system RelE/ParE family toxin [Bacteroides sp. OttesenSCG-928-D19]